MIDLDVIFQNLYLLFSETQKFRWQNKSQKQVIFGKKWPIFVDFWSFLVVFDPKSPIFATYFVTWISDSLKKVSTDSESLNRDLSF